MALTIKLVIPLFLICTCIVHSQSIQMEVYAEVEEPEILFGEIGAAIFDDSLNVYLLDRGNNKVHKHTPEGKYLFSFGEEGRGPGEFLAPSNSLMYDQKEHEIAVLDYRNAKIVEYSAESGSHRNSLILQSTTGVPINRLFYFNNEILLLGSHSGSDKMIHRIDKEGESIHSFGEFIDFGSFIHNPNGKMQLSQIHMSSLNGRLLAILKAPKRAKLFDEDLNIIHSFENDFLPKPWETHMEMTPTSYRSSFYSMSVNNLLMTDQTYFLQWSEVKDPAGPDIEHWLDLRELTDGELIDRISLNSLFILSMSRINERKARILARNSSFEYILYDVILR